MAWVKGPLPPKTYGWGAVAALGWSHGFLFADFQGDRVVSHPGGEIILAQEVAWYDNSLTLPPDDKYRQFRGGNPLDMTTSVGKEHPQRVSNPSEQVNP